MAHLDEQGLLELNKKHLVSLVLGYQSRFDNFCSEVQNDISEMKKQYSNLESNVSEIKSKSDKMERELSLEKKRNNLLSKKIVELEKSSSEIAQYSRCECLKISGISEAISEIMLKERRPFP